MRDAHSPLIGSILTAVILTAFGGTHTIDAQETAPDEHPPWCVYEPPEEIKSTGQHIVLIAGDDEYRSEEALPMLGKILSQRFGFRCTVLFPIDPETGNIVPDHQSNIPGMHHLDNADLVIMALRYRRLPDEQMEHFHEYLMAGKPMIALRTSTHAFRFKADDQTSYPQYGGNDQWPGGFGKQVLGETWVNHHGHHGRQSTRGVINPKYRDDPILTGVTDVWGPTDVYGIRDLPEGTRVLLYGQVIDGMEPDDEPAKGEQNDPMMPLAWTRTWTTPTGNQTPIFCTTMGSSTDFQNTGLRRLIVNAALKMTGNEERIGKSTNVDYVDEYEPTDFGFGSYRKGMRPADYDLDR